MNKFFLFLFLLCLAAATVGGQAFPQPSEVAPEMLALLHNDSLLRGATLAEARRNGGQAGMERRLSRAQADGNRPEIIVAANTLAWVYASQNNVDKSALCFDVAATAMRESGNRHGEALVTTEKAFMYLLKNRPSAAVIHCEKSLLLDANSVRLRAFNHYLKGRALSAQGLHAEAIASYNTALEKSGKEDNAFMSARSCLRLAEECIFESRDSDATKYLVTALKPLRRTGDHAGLAKAHAYQGVVDYLDGDYESALASFRRSQDMVPRLALLKLIRDTYLRLLSSSDVRNDEDKRSFYSKLYYQYRDSVQQVTDGVRMLPSPGDEAPDFNALLSRKKTLLNALAKPQLEYNRKLNEAELKRLKAEEALAQVNKENEAEIHERETHIARLQKEMAEQELALSRKELDAARNRQLIVLLLISSVAIVTIALVLLSRFRQKKRSHEEVRKAFEELSATHEELKRMQDQLVHSEKMASLGQLTAGIAHEIQNPLNFVNNFSEVSAELLHELEATSTPEQKNTLANIRQNLDKIAHHGKRADSIIKGMLLHSRNGTHEKQLTDINAMASEIIHLAYHGMRTREPGFTCTLTENLDPALKEVALVPQDFSRVLLNLFSNALYAVAEKKKTAGPGYSPELIVSTKSEGDRVRISVRDNGNGIDASILDRIFVPFFTTKPPGQGTGLGLSISYDIVTKGHQGTFEVDSRIGEYTEFILHIPRHSQS